MSRWIADGWCRGRRRLSLGRNEGDGDGVEEGGEAEVAAGEAVGVVGDEAEAHLVVADVDVGVVVLFFGEGGDAVDEGEGLGEVGEFEVANQFSFGETPFWEVNQAGFEFLFRQCGHAGNGSGCFGRMQEAGRSRMEA